MNKELEYKIREIINAYIRALESYETSFRMDMSNKLGVSESRLYLLPSDMYNTISGLKNEYWMHNVFMDEDSKYAQDYYDKTLQSFAKSGKVLNNETENGVIFEAMLLQALKEIPGTKIQDSYSVLPNVKSEFDFEGIGFNKRHGDIAFTIQGIKIPVLIDAKYSTDRSQIISRTGQEFNNINDLQSQIINEIKRGLSNSIAYDGKDTWMQAYTKAIEEKKAGHLDEAKYHYKIGKKQPKILIYIFKDKGMWSSQVVAELEDRVVDNASVIYAKNNKTAIGKAFNKDWLWYGNMKKF